MNRKASPGDRYLKDLTWEEKARQNPLYGVMSVDEFANAGADPTLGQLEQFFREGRRKAATFLLPWLAATATPKDARILEFGCGMGRLVHGVRGDYPDVVGVDVSRTMIERATAHVAGAEFHALEIGGGIPVGSATVDRAYSYAVFQHIKSWSVIVNAIGEISRVLKPGGYARLQFEMICAPAFASGSWLRRHTHAFESRSMIYGWTRRLGLPIPGLRFRQHDNWQGARPGYRQLAGVLRRAGMDLYGLEHFVEAPHLVWFLARRRSGEGHTS